MMQSFTLLTFAPMMGKAGVDIRKKANLHYRSIKDDAAEQALVRAEFKALGKMLRSNPSAGLMIASATINGQSFSAFSGAGEIMTNDQRFSMLGMIVSCLDLQSPISSMQISTF